MSDARQRFLELVKSRAVVHKTVTLASGQTSNYYIDGRMVLMHGESATLLGELVYQTTKDLGLQAIGGPETGALPMATAAAMRYHQAGVPMEGFFVRKDAKQHGLQKRIEGGFPEKGRVAIVEDVMTTGKSALGAIQAVQDAGAQIVAVVCIVDRLQGARELFTGMGLNFQPLFTLRDLGL
jgi:orotate phosphoribosyltransferase